MAICFIVRILLKQKLLSNFKITNVRNNVLIQKYLLKLKGYVIKQSQLIILFIYIILLTLKVDERKMI